MCTNFLLAVPQIPATANTIQYVSARCMELTGALATHLYLVPAQQQFPLVPNRSTPWIGQYGFVGLADPQTMAEFPCFMDGINEVGLSCAALWLPGTEFPSAKGTKNVEFSDLCAWVMSNFSSVNDLLEALPNIQFLGPKAGAIDYVPLHFIATDSAGQSVVIEFLDGQTVVYPPSYGDGATADGVLTNGPDYAWQRTNLLSYSHLSVKGGGTSRSTQVAPPVGNGLLGLPGDIMSASRFVKAATFRRGFGLLPADGKGWLPTPKEAGATESTQTVVNVALQMVQMIQATPYGTALIKPKDPLDKPSVGDWTMWQVARDHSNFAYYFNSAFNASVQKINLTQPIFGGGSVKVRDLKSIPVLPGPSQWYSDMTASLT